MPEKENNNSKPRNIMATLHLYTDASYSKETHKAVSGYLLFKTQQDHEAGINEESIIHTESFNETTNTRAEFKAMLSALEKIKEILAADPKDETKIKIYTDCQAITHLLSRRTKLEA